MVKFSVGHGIFLGPRISIH